MNRFSPGIPALLTMVSLACGGGGGGSAGDAACADMAAAVNACLADVNPYIAPMCRAVTCTGSKQAFVDSVTGHECNEAIQYDGLVQMERQGCTFPASCTGVAYWMYGWSGIPVASVVALCDGTTCSRSKSKAMQCVVELSPLTAMIEDVDACLVDVGGCPPFPLTG